jgi:hypothetical protein
MKFNLLKSKVVEKKNDIFLLHIGSGVYDLGIQIHKWGGIRIMLIWWHFIITFEK